MNDSREGWPRLFLSQSCRALRTRIPAHDLTECMCCCPTDALILIIQIPQHLHGLQVLGLVCKLIAPQSLKCQSDQRCSFHRTCTNGTREIKILRCRLATGLHVSGQSIRQTQSTFDLLVLFAMLVEWPHKAYWICQAQILRIQGRLSMLFDSHAAGNQVCLTGVQKVFYHTQWPWRGRFVLPWTSLLFVLDSGRCSEDPTAPLSQEESSLAGFPQCPVSRVSEVVKIERTEIKK